MLLCPNCQSLLTPNQNRWCCQNNHTFDTGKNGDVNLLLPQHKRTKSPGDSKAMVAARRDFLASGVYQPIAENIAKHVILLSQGEPVTLADAGCGEGYYLRQVQRLAYPQAQSQAQSQPQFIAWDISKFAVQSAAKQADFGQWLTASNARIPLADNCLDMLLSLFGFEVVDEFARVVKSGGFIITADAGEQHLIELRGLIYPEIKPYREKPLWESRQFRCLKQESLTYQVALSPRQIAQLLLMTPHFFRATAAARETVAKVSELTVTIDVALRCYQSI